MHPQAIRDASSKVDDMIRGLAAATHAPETNAPAPDDAVVEQGVQEPVEPAPEPVEDAPDLAREMTDLKAEFHRSEARYKSLQGMFNQQVEINKQLQDIIASMHAAPPAPAKSEEPAITKEDEDAFGADLVEFSRRAARAEMGAYVKQLEARIDQLSQQLTGVSQATTQTQYAAFVDALADAVNAETGGQFDAINNAPEFKAWLEADGELDDFLTAVRGMNMKKSLRYFRFYAKENAITGKQPEPPRVDPRLATQVSPGKSKSTPSLATQADGEKRQWTRSGIVEFYKKLSNGEFPKDTAEKLEREIAFAQKEGRVDYSR